MSISLSPYKDLLVDKKILLAYSGGIDSSALFHMLIDDGIAFDIAIVDYGIREQSKEEVAYAKELASKYNLKCHATKAPPFESNFEANARAFRYRFFEGLIASHAYDIILTAHQLGDQLEWLLMRLAKGAGASELVGLKAITHKPTHQILRPLLGLSKKQLLEYLNNNNHKYFIDSSNSDESYERNYFRNNFSDKLIEQYSSGIAKSFEYLNHDIEILNSQFETVYSHKECRVIKLHDQRLKSKAVDMTLKELGYLLSNAQRDEVAQNSDIVIGGKYAIGTSEGLIYITPYVKIAIPKQSKEIYRKLKFPPLVRGYCYVSDIYETIIK